MRVSRKLDIHAILISMMQIVRLMVHQNYRRMVKGFLHQRLQGSPSPVTPVFSSNKVEA